MRNMTNEEAKKVAGAVIFATSIVLVYYLFHGYINPYGNGLFWQLAHAIGWGYGWIIDLFTGPGWTGYWGAWFVIVTVFAIVIRRIALGAGAAAVLIILYALWSHGPPTGYYNARGEWVEASSTEGRKLGSDLALFLGGVIVFGIFLYLGSVTLGHWIGAAVVTGVAHTTGLMHHRAKEVPWKVWKWVILILAVPPILHKICTITGADIVATLNTQVNINPLAAQWIEFLIAVVLVFLAFRYGWRRSRR